MSQAKHKGLNGSGESRFGIAGGHEITVRRVGDSIHIGLLAVSTGPTGRSISKGGSFTLEGNDANAFAAAVCGEAG